MRLEVGVLGLRALVDCLVRRAMAREGVDARSARASSDAAAPRAAERVTTIETGSRNSPAICARESCRTSQAASAVELRTVPEGARGPDGGNWQKRRCETARAAHAGAMRWAGDRGAGERALGESRLQTGAERMPTAAPAVPQATTASSRAGAAPVPRRRDLTPSHGAPIRGTVRPGDVIPRYRRTRASVDAPSTRAASPSGAFSYAGLSRSLHRGLSRGQPHGLLRASPADAPATFTDLPFLRRLCKPPPTAPLRGYCDGRIPCGRVRNRCVDTGTRTVPTAGTACTSGKTGFFRINSMHRFPASIPENANSTRSRPRCARSGASTRRQESSYELRVPWAHCVVPARSSLTGYSSRPLGRDSLVRVSRLRHTRGRLHALKDASGRVAFARCALCA